MVEKLGELLITVTIVGLIFLGIATIVLINDKYETAISISSPATIEDFNETFLGGNGSIFMLNQTPSTLTAEVYNNTWLSFDGSGDSVSQQLIYFTKQNTTFSIWYNTSDGGTDSDALIVSISSGTHALLIQNGIVNYLTRNISNAGTNLNITSPTNNSLWNHVVVTISNLTSVTNVSIYHNGVINNSLLLNGGMASTNGLPTVSSGGTASFLGDLDEFRWYNRTLSSNEINQIYLSGRTQNNSLSSTLLNTYYPFNSNSGVNASNLVSGIGNGSIIGATWENDNVSLTLSGTTDYNQIDNNFTIINIDKAWTEIRASYEVITVPAINSSVPENVLNEANESFFQNTSLVGMIMTVSMIAIVIAILVGYGFVIRDRRT